MAKKAEDIDYSKYGGAGFEHVTASDLKLPFLMILQSNSPQCLEADPKYIDGAKPGSIMNSVTSEVFSGKDGVEIVPISFHKAYVEWTPRDSGGGFVRTHRDASILTQTKKNDKNQDMLENGNIIVTTAYHMCLIIRPDGSSDKVVISMTSTQLKKSRGWLTMMQSIQGVKNPPMFLCKWKLTTVPEKNESGSWYGWAYQNMGKNPIELLDECAETHKQLGSFTPMALPDNTKGDEPF